MRIIITILLVSVLWAFVQAQVITDFDTDSLENWRSEGDGRYYLESGAGNPGNCMRVDDDATGNTNLAIAPLKYIGNWSTADTTDSLITDIFVSMINGSLTSNLWAFRISGPGGTATSQPVTPALDQWNHMAVAINPASWIMSSGTWQDLLNYVDHFEVRAEYINGDEFVRLDNIELTFSPLIVPINPPVISNFENGTYQGWIFENTGGISIPTGGGNPGRYVRIADGTGISMAVAPPKFLGDWSQLRDQAAIMFDIQISNFTGPLLTDNDLIKLSGPGGEATIPVDSTVMAAYNRWHTLSILLSENNWNILSGNWNSLLADVRELRIVTEFISGSEIVWFDNFRISNSPPVAEFSAGPVYLFPGEEVLFVDLSLNAPQSWQWLFGDGESSTLASPAHRYMQPGSYDVQLQVDNHFGSDTLLKEAYIEVAGITDSILFADDFDDNVIHPAWRFKNGSWVEGNQTMIQNSNYFSTGYIGGCYALVGSRQWKNYRLAVDFLSSDDDKIGVVFNYQDANNFYLFTWQQQGSIRAIKRFIDGTESNLAIDSLGYQTNQWYHLEVTTIDGQIRAYIDSVLIFAATDTNLLSGRAGLYCHGNQSSFWDNFLVENLDYISAMMPSFQSLTVKTYALDQNYPNPFNSTTIINYQLADLNYVELSIYNLLGQRVETLVSKQQPAGKYRIKWDAGNFAAGVYFYKIEAGNFRQVRKMILLQ